jgi:hypothetical protein
VTRTREAWRVVRLAHGLVTLAVAALALPAPAPAQPPAPLSISGVTVAVTDASAVVSWRTNRPATSQVTYGVGSASELLTEVSPALLTSHEVTISGLAVATTYRFRALSVDGAGTPATSEELTFSTSPLRLTIAFKCPTPPCPTTYGGAIPMVVQLENVSGAPVFAIRGFAARDHSRRLVFVDPEGTTINLGEEIPIHGEPRLSFCHSRGGVTQNTGIPVVEVEVLPGPPSSPNAPENFELELTVDDVRRFWDLARLGRYTVTARLHLQTVATADAGILLTDCDNFPGTTLLDVGATASLARRDLLLVSNALEFEIVPDATPPATTVALAPDANAAGWRNQDVTLTFNASDDQGGPAGVARIHVDTAGAQTGTHVLPGATGTVTISTDGETTATFRAEDGAGNLESPQTVTVRVDKTPPAITIAPPSGSFVLNDQVAVTFGASDARSGLVASSVTGRLKAPGTPAVPVASGATVTLSRLGTTTLTVSASDVAGATGTASAEYAVRYHFDGFMEPLVNDSACATPPCSTVRLGKRLPVRFALYDARGTVIPTAVARIAVVQLSGAPPPTPPTQLGTWPGNKFRFIDRQFWYSFTLKTGVLSAGVWRIDVTLDDGSVHSVQVRLR